MLKAVLIIVAIGLSEVGTANAQSGGCTQWCRTNRCSGGMMSGSAPQCMNQCVAACQQKMKSKK
jgi:hypothetical protein